MPVRPERRHPMQSKDQSKIQQGLRPDQQEALDFLRKLNELTLTATAEEARQHLIEHLHEYPSFARANIVRMVIDAEIKDATVPPDERSRQLEEEAEEYSAAAEAFRPSLEWAEAKAAI